MTDDPDLTHLAAQWADRRDRSAFVPLAEGLRKRGALGEAVDVLLHGLALHPDYLPAHLVLGRVREDQGDLEGAEQALRGALDIDPSHPGVLEALARLADRAGQAASGRAWREALAAALPVGGGAAPAPGPALDPGGSVDDPQVEEPEEFVLTESLALLYRRQGHLDRAAAVYEALAERAPEDVALLARRDAVRRELDISRPRPFDARESGGRSVGEWLAAIASAMPPAARSVTGYDAFYQAPAAPSERPTDFEAFQAWLKELDR